MDGRSRWLPVLLISFALLLVPSIAAAGPKDAAATRVADDAIKNDYLALKFNEAAKKLRSAIATCGANGCSAQVRARVHRDLGVVLIAGLNRAAEGKKEFTEAVKADPRITLDKDLTTPAIEKAFQTARGNAGVSAPTTAAPAPGAAAEGDIVHTPAGEQAVLTPLPIYVELPSGVAAAKVLVMYKPFGATDWQKLELKRLGTGYGGEIPCQAVGSATGDLSYYVQASDTEGDILATSGTRKAPNKVPIQNEIAGEPPHLPGRPAPAKCKDKADCPPGFPGCSSKKSGTKGWGVGCEKDNECGEGLACKAGACETGVKRDSGEASGRACDTSQDCEAGEKCGAGKVCELSGSRAKKVWLSFHVQQDVSIVPSLKDACGNIDREAPPYVTCLAEDGFAYRGVPLPADPEFDTGNEIKGGPRVSTTRLLVDLSYLVAKNISIGARLGYVLNTQPGRDRAKLHAEGRLAYWFGADPFAKQSLRPYVAVMGGAAEVDDKYTVQVFETLCTTEAECARLEAIEPRGLQPNPKLTAWRRASTIFGGAAIGLMIPTAANMGILAEVKAQVFFPNKGYTVSPTIGYAFGF